MNTISDSFSFKDLLLIDIETVPQYQTYTQLPETWKSLWIDKNSKTMPENISPEEAYHSKAGILAEFGKIVCISAGYFLTSKNEETKFRIKSLCGHDEKKILSDFTELTGRLYSQNKFFQFAGHNIREFDIPYICRRMLIQQMPLPSYLQLHGAKPWDIKMVDTLQWWKFGDYKNYTSLHLLASVLNVPTSKIDMDGSMVQHVYYDENNLQRIADYCCRDVVVVANILLRFKNMPLLKEENIMYVE